MIVPDVAVVLGTYNRLALLKASIASIRRSCGALTRRLIVVDGGSTDGTVEWLREQEDVVGDLDLIAQGELLGAVKAFNAGFARAVDLGSPWVVVLNDDDELIGPSAEIAGAVDIMRADAGIGAVAFETDLRGNWSFEEWNGKPYANKGVFRREAGMAAARAMGDPDGRRWWGTDHHTYAADTEAGLWIWRLGWRIVRGVWLRVHDHSANQDDLRKRNVAEYVRSGSVEGYKGRWSKPSDADYNADDAARFGGRL